MAAKILGNLKDRDVVLCTLTSQAAGRALSEVFVQVGIPFTLDWEKRSVLKRMLDKERKEVCIVKTHRSQYSRARRTLDMMGRPFLSYITIHAN